MRRLFAVVIPMLLAAAAGFAQQQRSQSPGYLAAVKDAKSRIKEMTADQLKELRASQAEFTLVDVREDEEWAAGHAEGALHIGKGVIERDIEQKIPAKDARIVLYCGGGSRSALAADSITKMGYSNVWSLAGGIDAYKAAGMPVRK